MASSDPCKTYERLRHAPTARQRQALLDDLVTGLRPIIRATIEREMRGSALVEQHGPEVVRDAKEDLVQETVIKILECIAANPQSIRNIEAYAVTAAKSKLDDFYRSTFPKRYNASKRVGTHLRRNKHFYAWEFAEIRHGALAVWPPPPPSADPERVGGLQANGRRWAAEVTASILPRPPEDLVQRKSADGYNTAMSMWMALTFCKGAMPVTLLVHAVQRLENDMDPSRADMPDHLPAQAAEEEGPTPSEDLIRMWRQMAGLDRRQVSAILLGDLFKHVKLSAFVLVGAVSPEELAETLGFAPEHFERAVLPQLPWSNSQIAEHLHASKEEVAQWRWQGLAKLRRGAAKIDSAEVAR